MPLPERPDPRLPDPDRNPGAVINQSYQPELSIHPLRGQSEVVVPDDLIKGPAVQSRQSLTLASNLHAPLTPTLLRIRGAG